MADNEFKVGDRVAVSELYGLPNRGEVARLTNTQVIVTVRGRRGSHEQRFRKKDGCLVGGDQWSRSHIRPWTDDDEEAAENQRLSAKLRGLVWEELSNDQLRRMLEIADAT